MNRNAIAVIPRLSKILFLLILLELSLGGGGRFTAMGPVSLRMILFSVAVLITIPLLIMKEKVLPADVWKLMIGFAIVIAAGIIIGLANNNAKRLIFEDVKPLSYFLIFPFFYLTIDESVIQNVIKVIKTSSILMATGFILLLIYINLSINSFQDFYNSTFNSGELFFRGGLTFFYKGFLFLGVGTIFFYFVDYAKWKKLFMTILIATIGFSVTRGLLFSLALTFSIYFFATRQYVKAVYGLVLAAAIVVWGSSIIMSTSKLLNARTSHTSYSNADPTLLGDKNYSDNGRSGQAKEVLQQASFSSSLLGHGFGAGTPSRPIHMEISYLEIFHKQGLIGLTFWGCFAWAIFVQYQKTPSSAVANAFFYSSLFVFIESLTNQYFNNPIGMSVLMLSWCCLNKLKT